MLIAAGSEHELASRVTATIDVVVHYDNVTIHGPIESARDARAVARKNCY